MTDHVSKSDSTEPSRRRFLQEVGRWSVATGTTAAMLNEIGEVSASEASNRQVKRRVLGKTGLKVSEIGIGGHSWAYKQIPDGNGGMRVPTVDEAVEMIAVAMDMGVNFVDSCTPLLESSTPGEALKRLKARDKFIVAIRVSHLMKGCKQDQEEIYKWTEERLKLWQTDYVDLCLLCNTGGDTPQSGYWDMSYSLEALDKLKQQGKIRYTGFGCHFTPELFLEAFDKFGDHFDICSIPYNVRHTAAKTILPAAKKKNLGVITIKPFARGSLLKKRDLEGADAGLPRDMIAYVLEDKNVDICTCGVHTVEQVRQNLSASWTGLTAQRRQRLGLAAATPCPGYRWLEEGWRYA